MTDYLKIIDKYFADNQRGKEIYMIHVTLVTNKALEIGRKLGLSDESLRFIEEAAMLHDIGCCQVNMPAMNVKSEKPYLCHIIEGQKILEAEGMPKHARVAVTHTGVGIFTDEVRDKNLPIEEKDYLPETIEEKIICYADLFYSKNPDSLFVPNSDKKIRGYFEGMPRHLKILDEWIEMFE